MENLAEKILKYYKDIREYHFITLELATQDVIGFLNISLTSRDYKELFQLLGVK